MAVTNGWGQAAVNNTIDYGDGAIDNTIDWGKVYASSESGDTNIGTSVTPSFTNTKSIELGGIDDFVSLASRTQNFTDFTLSVWFNTTPKGGFNSIIGNSGAEGGLLFAIVQAGGVIRFRDNAWTALSGTITDGVWHHLAITYDSSSNQLKSYVDNSLFTTLTPGTPSNPTNSHSFNQIGRRLTVGFWRGNIDELAVFSSVLTSSDVSTIYGSGVPTSLASLNPVHWWRCGDGDSAPILLDNGSGGINGTMESFSTFNTNVPT